MATEKSLTNACSRSGSPVSADNQSPALAGLAAYFCVMMPAEWRSAHGGISIDPAIKHVNFVVPAKAGTQRLTGVRRWIPAFAGMTNPKNFPIYLITGSIKSDLRRAGEVVMN